VSVGQPKNSSSVRGGVVRGGVVATTLTTPIKMAKRPKEVEINFIIC
jgi:hypothetical protein